MESKYIFHYKKYMITIFNKDIYEEFYTLRDTNIFYALSDGDYKIRLEEISKNQRRLVDIIKSINLDYSFSGICGLGYMYYYMINMDNTYIKEKEKIDSVLKKVVNSFLEIAPPIIDDNGNFNIIYDYYKGISGVFAYILQTTKYQNDKKAITQYLIKKISEINYRTINTLNISVAHGISSLLNILRLNASYEYSKKEINIINNLLACLEERLKDKVKESERISLSWGNGDLGVGTSICLLSKKINVKISNELLELIKFMLSKGDKRIFEKYNPCSGVYGFNRMIELIANYKYDLRTIILEENKVSVKQVKEIDNYCGRDFSIVDGTLSRVLLDNISTDKIDEYYKLFML